MLVKISTGKLSEARLNALLEGLARLASVDLKNNSLPPLYTSGVRYRREKPDMWSTPSDVLSKGTGDCEDLSAWRVAELRSQGVAARPVAYRTGKKMWHVVVEFPNGEREDPSRRLGM